MAGLPRLDRLPFGSVPSAGREWFDIRLPRLSTVAPDDIRLAGSNVSLTPVSIASPRPMRIAVERLARYFLRESGTSMMQFCAIELSDPYQALLWRESDTCLGACCFRQRDNGMALQWVWLHPYARSRGLLRAAWPLFRERFGEQFRVEGPYSAAMRAFLIAQQHLLEG